MRDVLEFWIQLHSHPETEISFKFIPKILMSKECIHFFGPLCISALMEDTDFKENAVVWGTAATKERRKTGERNYNKWTNNRDEKAMQEKEEKKVKHKTKGGLEINPFMTSGTYMSHLQSVFSSLLG
jgi:hypothetical protein